MSLNKTVLKSNAIFLMLVGSLQMVFELISHFMGVGPLADRFLNSPYTLGFFEAHGLAVLIGILLWRSAANPEKFWHQLAVVVHILLGGANLLFWDSFIKLGFITPGIAATVFHGIFVIMEAYCAWRTEW